MFLKYFGSLAVPNYGSYSLIRLAGVGLLIEGALLLAVRPVQDAVTQRRICIAMAVSHGLTWLILWAQQIAIWESPLGVVLTVWMWATAAAFGLLLLWRHPLLQAS